MDQLIYLTLSISHCKIRLEFNIRFFFFLFLIPDGLKLWETHVGAFVFFCDQRIFYEEVKKNVENGGTLLCEPLGEETGRGNVEEALMSGEVWDEKTESVAIF